MLTWVTVLMSGVMVVIHVAGSYLGLRGLVVPRGIGTYISIYESLYYMVITVLALTVFSLPILLMLLIILMLITHLIGMYLYLRGYLSEYANSKSLRYYGVYELAELMIIIVLLINLVNHG